MIRRAIRPGRVYGDKEYRTQSGFNSSNKLTNFSVINKHSKAKSEIRIRHSTALRHALWRNWRAGWTKQIPNHNFSKSNIINTILVVTQRRVKKIEMTEYAFFRFLSHFEPFYPSCLIRRYYAQSLG